jgi:nucleoside-diphosphate-sugar epimerase
MDFRDRGGAGLIGSKTVALLRQGGHAVVAETSSGGWQQHARHQVTDRIDEIVRTTRRDFAQSIARPPSPARCCIFRIAAETAKSSTDPG